MAKSKGLFDITCGQRNHYVIALQFKGDSNYTIDNYWRDCKEQKPIEKAVTKLIDDYEVSHYKYITDISHHRGTNRVFSYNTEKNKRGELIQEKPYCYDLFAIRMSQSNIMILVFPFKELAEVILERLRGRKVMILADFIKPVLTSLLMIGHSEEFKGNEYTSRFSSVDLTLGNNPNLTSVCLTGDRPLETKIYKDIFKRIVGKESTLDKCALKFESDQPAPGLAKSTANIHMDRFGNYKFYLHASSNNLLSLAALFRLLESYDCLEFTSSNPLNRIPNE